MRREILTVLHKWAVGNCCPGHDKWPDETYKNRRSKKARKRDKAKEHRLVRRILNRQVFNEEE